MSVIPDTSRPQQATEPPNRTRRGLTWAVLALLSIAAGGIGVWAAITYGPSPTANPAPAGSQGAGMPRLGAGTRPPEFSIPSLSGSGRVSLSDYQGRPVIINFFASWCPSCQAELKAFGTASSAAGSKVAFIGIDTNDHAPAKARELLAAGGDHYPVGVDTSTAIATSYDVVALPTTVFINAKGKVVGESFGAQTVSSLATWIHRLEHG